VKVALRVVAPTVLLLLLLLLLLLCRCATVELLAPL
jgi:hypothetical protein